MNESDLSLIKFAMGMRLLNMEQLEKCVDLQKTLEVPISTIFMGRKLITEEQYDKLLEKVRDEQQRKDSVFAKVALALQYLTKEELSQAHQDQEQSETAENFGDYLLQKGLLTEGQVQIVLANVQSTKIMHCPACHKRYSMTPYQPNKTYNCSTCNGPLELTEEEQIEQMLRSRFSWNDAANLPTTSNADDMPVRTTLTEKDIIPSSTVDLGSDTGAKTLDRDDIFAQHGDHSSMQTKVEQIHFMGSAKDLQLKLSHHHQDELCGTKIGDYQILERIGAGAMGVVYKAEQIRLQRVVAIKMLNPTLCGDDFYVKRFIVEARSAAKLNHPNIVQIYDADICDRRLFYSMEYIRGETISSIMERKPKLPAKNCLDIVLQIAHALVETYEAGIVHRDIKPENIMLTVKGLAKLADLGLARNVDYAKEMEAQESGMVMGTPYYVAPEQITNANDVDCRTDIYSLGASCYAMLTGEIPFRHPDPRVVLMRVIKTDLKPASEIDSSIPPALSWVITKMVEKKPDDRFQTPLELIEVLEGLQSNLAGDKRQESPPIPAGPMIPASAGLRDSPELVIAPPVAAPAEQLAFSDEIATTGVAARPQAGVEPGRAKTARGEAYKRPGMREEPGKKPVGKIDEHRVITRGTAKAAPASTTTSTNQSDEEKETPLALFGGIALIVIAVAVVVWMVMSGDKPEPIKNPNPPIPTISPEEARKIKFDEIAERAQKFLLNPSLGTENEVNHDIVGFIQVNPDTPEAKNLNELLPQIDNARKKRDATIAYQELQKIVDEKLAIPHFKEAFQAVEEQKVKECGEVYGPELQILGAKITKQAAESLEKLNQEITLLVKSCEFNVAIQQLQAAEKIYLTDQLAAIQDSISNIQQKQNENKQILSTLVYRLELQAWLKKNNYNFAEAQNFLNNNYLEKIKQSNSSLNEFALKKIPEYQGIEILMAEMLGVESLLSKQLFAALQFIEQEQKKTKQPYTFEFEEIPKPFSITGHIKKIGVNITIYSTQSVSNKPVEKMTWNCKRKILENLIQAQPEIKDTSNYQILLYELYRNNAARTTWVEEKIQVASPEQLDSFQSIHIQFLAADLQRQIKDKNSKEATSIIKILQQKYLKHPTWIALRSPLTQQILTMLKDNPSLKDKQSWYKLFEKQDIKTGVLDDFK